MRTNIDLDDTLLAETMTLSGKGTKKGAVEEAMRHYTRTVRFKRFLEKTRGIGWDGDLDQMRLGLNEAPTPFDSER